MRRAIPWLAIVVALLVVALLPEGAGAVTAAPIFAPAPADSITTAVSDTASAVASDPTLTNLGTDLITTEQQLDFMRTVASIEELNTVYAGGSADLLDSLGSGSWGLTGSQQANMAGQAAYYQQQEADAVAAMADGSSTEALTAGELVDVAGGTGLLDLGALGLAGVAGGVLVAGTLAYLDITTGTNPISQGLVKLFGGEDPTPAHTGANSLLPAGMRWQSLPVPTTGNADMPYWTAYTCPAPVGGHCYATLQSDPWSGGISIAGNAEIPCTVDACVASGRVLVEEVEYGTTWYVQPMDFTLHGGGLSTGPVDISDPAICGANGTMNFFQGWPLTNPSAVQYYSATSVYACTSTGKPGADGYAAIQTRRASAFHTGLPRGGTVPSGTPTTKAQPVLSHAGLFAAINNLNAHLGDGHHTHVVGLIDGSTHTQVGGATVTVPGTLTIPAPGAHELETDYAARVQSQGFTGTITRSNLTDATIDPTRGPSEVSSTAPAVGTSVDPATAITVFTNPDTAPAAAGSPALGGGTSCGLTPPSSSLDFSPVTGAAWGSAFPFSLLPFMGGLLGGIASDVTPPTGSLTVFGRSAGDLSGLAQYSDIMSVWRGALCFLMVLSAGWYLWKRTLGA
jgi:hypothetical protein